MHRRYEAAVSEALEARRDSWVMTNDYPTESRPGERAAREVSKLFSDVGIAVYVPPPSTSDSEPFAVTGPSALFFFLASRSTPTAKAEGHAGARSIAARPFRRCPPDSI